MNSPSYVCGLIFIPQTLIRHPILINITNTGGGGGGKILLMHATQ